MNIALFGATGATGRHLVDQALAADHHITALVRTPAALPVVHDRLRIVPGDVRDRDVVAAVIAGQDAVVSTLGPDQRGPVSLCTEAIAAILPAMARPEARRLIVLSAYGAADSHHRNLYNRLLWLLQREKMLDKERMEALIRQSDTAWTIVRPSALSNGPRTGHYRLGTDLRMRVTSKIARADLADGLLQQLTDTTYLRQTPAITT